MTYGHRPVMLEEVAGVIDRGPGSVYIDATVGLGGHAERLAEMTGPEGRVLGVDRDPAALAAASDRLARFGPRVALVKHRFSELGEAAREAGIDGADGILFDLGVSSPQLDQEDRGFSYHGTGPLDMRMDQSAPGETAADLLQRLDESELARVFSDYGEERWAWRIARFIVQARDQAPIRTADELVAVVKKAVPAAARREGGHPARRVFQALRISVNSELSELHAGIDEAITLLRTTGRVVVLSYHSLEDRIVKTAFRQAEKGCTCPPELPVCVCGKQPTVRIITRKPLLPGEAEVAANPRARSAKLRAAERLPVGL